MNNDIDFEFYIINQTNYIKINMSIPKIFYKSSIEDIKKSIKYEQVKENKGGLGKSAILQRSEKIYIQTPKMYCPFGVSNYNGNYSISLSCASNGKNKDIEQFEELMNKLDDCIIEEIIENKEWIDCLNISQKHKNNGNKDILKNLVEGFYSSNLKYSGKKDKNGNEYPPLLKIKLPKYKDGNYVTTIWSKSGKETDKLTDENIMDRIPKGSHVRVLFQVQTVWFSSGTKCGVSFNAVQMKVYTKKNENKCLMVNEDSESDENENETKMKDDEFNEFDEMDM